MQLKRCLRLKILNGVNDETRIKKASGRQQGMELQKLHSYIQEHQPTGLIDKR